METCKGREISGDCKADVHTTGSLRRRRCMQSKE